MKTKMWKTVKQMDLRFKFICDECSTRIEKGLPELQDDDGIICRIPTCCDNLEMVLENVQVQFSV